MLCGAAPSDDTCVRCISLSYQCIKARIATEGKGRQSACHQPQHRKITSSWANRLRKKVKYELGFNLRLTIKILTHMHTGKCELESLLDKKFTAGYQSVVDETNARRVRPCNLNRGSGHETGGGE
ncbi:hypothetical protein RRG08_010773 [Elysia crispata]|uniref:Uncharacterized protein n=1 Tax=Elysia crispata TaxID=231223 RepID=A0AAE1A3N2_9GAST|nr:hypothetical protein RRG08_010773 [Elysia crispata]